jgi:hypothetical protein
MTAKGHPPVTDAERQRVAELHAQGKSRNAIATDLGRSGRTISKIAAELGLTFERTRTAAATAAKKVDGAARRAQLQLDLLEAAQKHLGQYFAETTVFNFGGKENDFNSRTMPEPPHRDKQAIANAVKALADTALKLADYDRATDAGGADIDRWLTAMTDGGTE